MYFVLGDFGTHSLRMRVMPKKVIKKQHQHLTSSTGTEVILSYICTRSTVVTWVRRTFLHQYLTLFTLPRRSTVTLITCNVETTKIIHTMTIHFLGQYITCGIIRLKSDAKILRTAISSSLAKISALEPKAIGIIIMLRVVWSCQRLHPGQPVTTKPLINK